MSTAIRKVSIHKTTTGGVSDFLDDESFECVGSMKLLSFLAGALLRYEEEGVELSPQVVLCQSIESTTKSFPGGKFYIIGMGEFSPELGKKVLKECAALARNGWAVFVERVTATKVRYGVFSYLASPTSLGLRDMIGVDDQTFAVLIERTDRSNVRLSGSKGNILDVAFSTTRDERTADDNDIAKFARSVVPKAASPATTRYMTGLVARLLAESHGTILVCTDQPILSVSGMTDAVTLDPAIEVISVFDDYHTIGTADTLMELQRTEGLLGGLLQSDGIVVFNTLGQVSAYRVFYKPPPQEPPPLASTKRRAWFGFWKQAEQPLQLTGPPITAQAPVTGGARRRAFQGVSALVGTGLNSALFRSQDGLTIFAG